MRILLLGEYSNVHATLAEGLRQLGHDVTVASNGDFWKNYPRDIDLARKPGRLGGLRLLAKVWRLLPRWRGYDVVQLINPMFLELRAERIRPIYDYLRKYNRKVVMGAFGMDYYWVSVCTKEKPLRYSDFNIGPTMRTNPDAVKDQRDWLDTPKGRLNQYMARDCDAIVAGLYEYWAVYSPYFASKAVFIPFPIQCKQGVKKPITDEITHKKGETTRRETEITRPVTELSRPITEKIRLFIGINKARSEYKGTDIMLRAAKDVAAKYPDRVELRVAESVPFSQYVEMMNGSDAILDQLYSYTPAMNALEAMSRGIVCIGGGEPENYEILGEEELRPIINVEPTYESVYRELEQLALHPERIALLRHQSIAYIQKHHDFVKVARQYERLYHHLLS